MLYRKKRENVKINFFFFIFPLPPNPILFPDDCDHVQCGR